MKILVGTDIVEINRIKELIENNESFINRVFSDKEIEYCFSKKISKYQSFAARFAAKEAIYKALSNYLNEYNWSDFEVINSSNGRPIINLKMNLNNIKILSQDISLSHSKDNAIAIVTFMIDEV